MLKEDLLLVKQSKPYKAGRLSAWHIAAKEGHASILRLLMDAVLSCGDKHPKLNSSLRCAYESKASYEAAFKS